MQHLRNLALVASMLCLGLSPAMAMSHAEGKGGHHGPPQPPAELVEIIEEILADEDHGLSDAAVTMLAHLIMSKEERKEAGKPEFSDDFVAKGAKDEIAELFKGLLEEDIPEPAEKYIKMMFHQMEGEHGEGGHDGPPPPPESVGAFIDDFVANGDHGLSDVAVAMLEHLLMSKEGRKEAGMPEISAEEMESGKEEIAELFEALLEEGVPEDVEKYIHMILGHMSGEHMDGEHMGGCGEHMGGPCGEHGEGGEDHGPPPPPESLAVILEDIIENDEDISEMAAEMLSHLLMTHEERVDYQGPEYDLEVADIREELLDIFKAIRADDELPEDAVKYLDMMIHHLENDGPDDQ